MKLEVGMYVRTNKGIFQIRNNKTFIENKIEYIGVNGRYTCIDVNTIIKASHNIIDLIEVGDYVNGYLIIRKTTTLLTKQLSDIKPNEIKSIVTKEQFESMQYKVD